MTEHIVSFSIGIDDDTIKRTIQDKAIESIKNDIKKDVLDRIFTHKYYFSKSVITINNLGDVELSNDAVLTSFATEIIEKAFDACRDEIINLAADKLADSYKRTKAWKDVAGNAIDEVTHGKE